MDKAYEDLSEEERFKAKTVRSEEFPIVRGIVSKYKKSLHDRLNNSSLGINDGAYWTFVTRGGILGSPSNYDYKIIVKDDLDNITKVLLPQCVQLVHSKLLIGLKFKNSKTPLMREFILEKPPLILYMKKAQYESVISFLKQIGISEYTAINRKDISDYESI